jgi:D-cysteine desulfhydrase
VERLRRLEETMGVDGPLWIKRDDRLGTAYGGNKPRKLEFLLGNMVSRGRRSVVTVGGLGSNHCLATAIYGGEAGLQVHACLVEQPLTPETEETLARMASLGATLHFATSGLEVRARILALLARDTAGWPLRPPGLILPGGSVPLGTLGIVNAALELGEQVESGIALRPTAIFVALGSGGTHAGLAAGLHLLGWDVPVIGVRVSDRLRLDRAKVAKLAERTLDLLRRADPSRSIPALAPGAMVVREGYLGEGYGHPTEAGDRAGRLLRETEGLFMDRTYTGKAMAAMLDAARGGEVDGPLLFWNTYNSRALPAPDPHWRERLPTSLRRHLEARP